MILKSDRWNLEHLHSHLQSAVDLELWTIPFYMSALYSIQDRTSTAFDLLLSIVNQEMLHLQLAANISNAYGLMPKVSAPTYDGTTIPHLNFDLDTPDPRNTFQPFSAEIGPLDVPRINAMCLIEYPEYGSTSQPDLRDTVTEYGSIGEFYDAVEYGAKLLERHIHGINQVDLFSAYYRNAPKLIVEASGAQAYSEVALLINVIRDQGEARKSNDRIMEPFRNTADDTQSDLSHFDKFMNVRKELPTTYPLKAEADITARDRELQNILVTNFTALRGALQATFSGRRPEDFETLMFSVGGNISSCWKNGVPPKFS